MRLLSTLCAFLLMSLPAFSAQFEEGKHYQVLENPVSEGREIREFFSFYCPHCFRFESFIAEVDGILPEGMELQKNHISGMPGQNAEIELALSKALIVAEHLKVKEKMIAAIFTYIHVNKATFSSQRDIRNLFIVKGVDPEAFDKAYGSFSVNALAKKMQSKTKALQEQGIRGVPMLIVHGKYRPILDEIKSYDDYKALLRFLLAQA